MPWKSTTQTLLRSWAKVRSPVSIKLLFKESQASPLSKHARLLLEARRAGGLKEVGTSQWQHTLQGEPSQLSSVCRLPHPASPLLTPPHPSHPRASTLRRAHNKALSVHGVSTCAHSLTWRFVNLSKDFNEEPLLMSFMCYAETRLRASERGEGDGESGEPGVYRWTFFLDKVGAPLRSQPPGRTG